MNDPAKNSGPRRLEADHPSVERLTAYHAGELSPAEADSIQEHLANCPACADVVLELPGFYEAMEAEELKGSMPSPAETAASWQAVRARLGPSLAGAAPAAAPARENWFRRLRRTSPGKVHTLAACLAAFLIGFFLSWMRLHSPEPTSVAVVYPPGQGEVLRGPGAGKPLSVSLGETGAVLVLPLPRGPAWPEYRIEVRSPGGEVRFTSDAALVPGASAVSGEGLPPRFVTVALSRGQLAVGEYRLRILGVRGGRGEVIGEEELQVNRE